MLRRRRQGFSLVELMVALATLGLVATLALRTFTNQHRTYVVIDDVSEVQQSAAGRHTTQASQVARAFLEQAHRLPWSDLGSAVGTWTAPAWGGATSSVSARVDTPGGGVAAEKTYDIEWRVSEVGLAGCLREVEVRVRWPEARTSVPKQSVLATRRYNWGAAGC